ncbi:DUF805 domain-containing protein [Dyella amyloliquefaciens]|uniref:DUF805 domain-containing protein n=1 Tax=Dyella amyloliquefaciens TaxID=1770545 RepID=UPI00102E6AFA|nr:DUF805 domain-containing protein [Dyella amyloliquefaciens]
MEWYLRVIREHYADFNGRARREEFWMFTLVNIVIAFVIGFVFGLMKMHWLSSIYSLAVLVPGIAVGARRLHDIGKSGWMLLIGFVPLVGLYLIYLLAQDSEPRTNRYGANPKAVI